MIPFTEGKVNRMELQDKELIEKCLIQFDEALKLDDNKLIALDRIFSDDKVFECIKRTNEFAPICQCMAFSQAEERNGITDGLLRKCKDRYELMSVIEELKYLLLRIEFLSELQDEEKLIGLISDFNLSPIAVVMMVKWTNCKKFDVLANLSRLFITRRYLDYAIVMLQECNRLSPGKEEIQKSIKLIEGLK